jgi:hypothetical protein
MGSGNPSTSTNPMSDPASSGAGVPFWWNISSGFGPVPSQAGDSITSRGFKFPWVSIPFHEGTSLRGNLSPWGYFPLLPH